MKLPILLISLLSISLLGLTSCKEDYGTLVLPENTTTLPPIDENTFYFGADLSYVNQILDHKGIYKDQGVTQTPYKIFKYHGANLARFRLWHNPAWTKEIYGSQGTQMYNDLTDVEKSIRLAKAQGMYVLLDLHYSDTWADPGNQKVPKAWTGIKDIQTLKDSVYNYTFTVLQYLNNRGLMPELVQVGNETNCGMLYSDAPAGFPVCEVCNGKTEWVRLGEVINSGISAVRKVSESSNIKSKVILHIADPKNVDWWFTNITGTGKVSDFEVVGFSYYPLWQTAVAPFQLAETIRGFKTKFQRNVMILETAYPWTKEGYDGYANQFGGQTPITGYPYTQEGQANLMYDMTQSVIDGGGSGIIYWEPAWITSEMKDLYGSGSSWENSTFFDFQGNTIQGIDFMNRTYNR